MSGKIGTLDVPHHTRGLKPASTASKRDILGVKVSVFTRSQAIAHIENTIAMNVFRPYAFLNAHGANLAFANAEFKACLNRSTVLSDGIGVDLGSRVLYGDAFPDNLNGTDFIPDLMGAMSKPMLVHMIGGQPGVAEDAAAALQEAHPHHRFKVIRDGYFKEHETADVLEALAQERADIVLVAFGNPKQELWISKHMTEAHGKAVFGVGALFDFLGGRVPRAPRLMIALRIEWLYRLSIEPRRMWRRYVLGNPAFLARILGQKLFGRRHKGS
ncbi:MAG: WecB/TagA/CpsF family glycosyltransferase [Pseudomonadota bacterium]